MRIVAEHSHLNGKEHLLVHHPKLWEEVQSVIESVVAYDCKTKKPKERTIKGRMPFSSEAMNMAFGKGFSRAGWQEGSNPFCVASDEKALVAVHNQPQDERMVAIEETAHEQLKSRNQTDFVKGRVAVEMQFGKCDFVAPDLYARPLSFYVSDIIDVGIEILPMKELEQEMSSGVAYYERDLLNIIRQGRGVPAVPLVLIGVAL